MTLSEKLRGRLAMPVSSDLLSSGDSNALPDTPLVPAAVLIAITDRRDPGVLLTRRTAHLRRHAGQVAFPGGRVDAADADAVAAALREADEEIGLMPNAVDVISTLDPYRTVTGFSVTPVVGLIPPDLPLNAQAEEVDAIFEVPLAFLLDPANCARKAAEYQGEIRHYYEIMWNDFRIWGATAAMIVNFARRLEIRW